jgi:hypothetical protein
VRDQRNVCTSNDMALESSNPRASTLHEVQKHSAESNRAPLFAFPYGGIQVLTAG